MKIKVVILIFAIVFLNSCAIFRHPDWKSNNLTLPSEGEQEFVKKNVVMKYAPIIHQYTSQENLRRNFLADFQYDGNDKTSDNRDNKEKYPLNATIYYSIVETDTHYFVTYLLYHVDDGWTDRLCKPLFYWFGGQHENDGENIQLVIEKNDGKNAIIIMAFQNHKDTDYLLHPKLKKDGYNKQYGTFSNCNFEGTNPVFFLEPGKHAIYTKKEDFHWCASNTDDYISFYPSDKFYQSDKPDSVGDILQLNRINVKYEYGFKSIKTELWDHYRNNKFTGNSGIMDGGINISFERDGNKMKYKKIPRFFDSDEYSIFLIKKDSGIMPFSFGGGHLFFDPAYYYNKKFIADNPKLKELNWKTEYLYNPYLPECYCKEL